MVEKTTTARYAGRRTSNAVATALALAATAFGLGWLVLILGALLWNGFSGLSVAVFTQMTPPPGSKGSADFQDATSSRMMRSNFHFGSRTREKPGNSSTFSGRCLNSCTFNFLAHFSALR